MTPVEILLALLALLAKTEPLVADWLAKLANGEAKCIDQLLAVLPDETGEAAAVLRALTTENDTLPPEYE